MIRITTIPTASPRPIPIRRSPNTIPTIVTINGTNCFQPFKYISLNKAGFASLYPTRNRIAASTESGIGLGLAVGIVVILIKSYQNSYFLHIENETDENKTVKMTLAEEVTFINKGAIIKELNKLKENSYLIMDVRKVHD